MASKQIVEAPTGKHFLMFPNELVIIGLDTSQGEEHPLYDTRIHLPVDEGMVLNIDHYGVLQPVVVRKQGDRVEVVAGRQRVRAAREVNKRRAASGVGEPLRVPVLFNKSTDSVLAGVQISENEVRRGDSPLDKAKKAQRLRAQGHSEDQIALAFGVGVQTIENWSRMLDLTPAVQAAVEAGDMTATAAVKLADVAPEQQDAIVAAVQAAPKEGKGRKKKAGDKEVEAAAKEVGAEIEKTSKMPGKKVLKALLLALEEEEMADEVSSLDILRWIVTGEQSPALQSVVAALNEMC